MSALSNLLTLAGQRPWTSHPSREGCTTLCHAGQGYAASVQIHQTPRRMGLYDEPRREANARLIPLSVNHLVPLWAALSSMVEARTTFVDLSDPVALDANERALKLAQEVLAELERAARIDDGTNEETGSTL